MKDQLMRRLMRELSMVIASLVVLGCGSILAKDTDAIESKGVRPIDGEVARACLSQWEPAEKLAFLDQAVAESNREVHSADQAFLDYEQRARLSILSAGIMPDSLPLITMERDCWAHFYEAHRELRAANTSLALRAASAWRTCLQANFPDRLRYAEKYFVCFGLPPTN